MAQLIDRRVDGKNKSAVNRQRFIRRFKRQIRSAVADAVAGRSITDAAGGEKVRIPARDIKEPQFRHAPGGRRENVHPGNTDFVRGDRFRRPQGGAGQPGAGEASDSGVGEDDFVFELSRDEFLEILFEDLELPDLASTELKEILEHRTVRAGFTRDGVPANINIVRSLRGGLARRIAVRGQYKRRLRELQDELDELEDRGLGDSARARELREEVRRIARHIEAIPFIEELDLRFHNRVPRPEPSSRAVMFCLMDVSGSMDERRKALAKRFFLLLYMFLERSYEHVEVVFIRHHVTAKEVGEEEFFSARETGGTVVSSALRLMDEIVRERYPSDEWNIYAAQASDGENFGNDSGVCRELLRDRILPRCRYYAYVEVCPLYQQNLWQEYARVAAEEPKLQMKAIHEPGEIFPVFHELFARRSA